jgi:filamentous hemagglutinin family protein
MATSSRLLLSSALLAPGLALAQAPEGGRVVAGQASIAQTPARTQVTQGSDRAVVEWRRLDVGPGHQLDIRQPGAASWSLQRVTGGDPSAIAGRVTSNGGVALVNPAGIVFHQGAQVDVAALIATTSDTANAAFMAGRMAFDGAPRPGARVENRGRITVADQGLAALVAPGVANSGTIRARLGRVALAGGEAFTLDLAGDGLLSLDVTRQVATAPSGAAALVTNSGVIEAEGGQVTLTARAASGLLETLVEAGGRISATGGVIEATAPGGGVRLPAGALLDTSGAAAGGTVTAGAGARSRPGAPERLSARTTVERGATLRTGRGGTAIVHAEARTALHGRVEAEGGVIEVSSRNALALDGEMHAPGGAVLVDPVELRIVGSLSGATEPAEITAAAVGATTGALTLQAERRIRVEARVVKGTGPLTLETTAPVAAPGDGIHIARPLAVTGDLVLRSAGDITQAPTGAGIAAGTLEARSSGGAVRLDAATNAIRAIAGGAAATRFDLSTTTALSVDGAVTAPAMRIASNGRLSLFAPLIATGTVELAALRGVSQQAAGAGISAGTLILDSPLGAVLLDGAGNRIGRLGETSAPLGLTLVNETGLEIAGGLSGGRVSLTVGAGDLTQAPGAAVQVAELAAFAPDGSVLLEGASNTVPLLRGAARDRFALRSAGPLTLSAPLSAAHVALRAAGGIAQDPGATLAASWLDVTSEAGSVLLDDPGNAVAALGEAGAANGFRLSTSGALSLEGLLAAPEVMLVADAIGAGPAGRVEAGLLRADALTGDVVLTHAGNAVAALGAGGAARDFRIAGSGPLAVTGALDAGRELALDADALRLAAPLDAPRVMLRARAGDLVQEGGRIASPRLDARAAGGVRLEAAGNALAAVSGAAGTSFRIATSGALRVEGVAAPEVVLAAGGTITQDAAPIETDSLALSVGGRVELRAAANAIRALAAVGAPGGLLLSTGTGLRLTAPVAAPWVELSAGGDITQMPGAPLLAGGALLSAGGDILLEEAGNALPRLLGAAAGGAVRIATGGALSIEGAVQAGTVIALQAAGDLVQLGDGAGLAAPLLELRSLDGNVALAGAGNRFDTLGNAGAAGVFDLRHECGAPLRLLGLLSAPSVQLGLPAGLEGAGGALRTEALRLAADGAVRLEAPGHRIGAVAGRAAGLFLAAEGALAVTEALDIAGGLSLAADSLALLAPVAVAGHAALAATGGDIAQAAAGAGLRVGGALMAQASGSVALLGEGNALPRLSGGTAGDGFAVRTEGALAAGGVIAGETVTLRAAGPMTLDGADLRAGRAVLVAAPGGLGATAPSSLSPRDPARLPVLLVDTRRDGLTAIPDGVVADRPGLPAAAQPTQLGAFGPVSAAAAGGAVLDLAAGASPVFLLLDRGSALGQVAAGRLGLLGQGGSAFLVGTLAGAGGDGAAPLVVLSGGGAGYLFNGCVMGAALCAGAQPGPGPAPPEPPAPAPPDPVSPPAPRASLPDDPAQRLPQAPSPWSPWPLPWPLPPLVAVEEAR